MSEPVTSALCAIPANPDISGIGVRIAIYAQSILCFILALWALWDGEVTLEELEHAEIQATTNLVLAFAILISSIVQARTLGMSSYHASIVLMMSWINNTNAFVYFILYVRHKIGLAEDQGRVEATWDAWLRHIWEKIYRPGSINRGSLTRDTESNVAYGSPSGGRSYRETARALVKRIALVLGSVHLTVMAAMGIWLWSDLKSFGIGRQAPEMFGQTNGCIVDSAVVAILGQDVPLHSSPLRSLSLAVYALFLIPGFNIVVPMAAFLAIYLFCRKLSLTKKWDALPAYIGLAILLAVNVVFIVDIELTLRYNVDLGLASQDEREWGFGQILAILLLLLPIRDLVEAILSRRLKNRQRDLDENVKRSTRQNNFEMVQHHLAKGGTIPSPKSEEYGTFWDLVVENQALDYIMNFRLVNMNDAEKAIQSNLLVALQKKDYAEIDTFYQRGADLIAGGLHSDEATDIAFWYAVDRGHHRVAQFHFQHRRYCISKHSPDGQRTLLLASDNDDMLLAKILSDYSFMNVNKLNTTRSLFMPTSQNGHDSVNNDIGSFVLCQDDLQLSTTDANGWTVLMHTSSSGSVVVSSIILKAPGDINVNATDHEGTTALMLASQRGYGEIVKMMLLRTDIDINAADSQGRTALMLALVQGQESIVKLLVQRDDIHVNPADSRGRTALILALEQRQGNITETLLARDDIQVNAADSQGRTALMLALEQGQDHIAEILLARDDIQVNAADSQGRTALMLALGQRHGNIAETLLARDDIQVNAADSQGWTALMSASLCGYTTTVKILFQRPDLNINHVKKDGWTALMHASYRGHQEIVKMFLERPDVELSVERKDGKTAATLARNETIARMIAARSGETLDPTQWTWRGR